MKLASSISKEEKKLIKKMFFRSGTMYASVNPVTMGGAGFCYSLMPFINEFYKNDEEKRRKALERHTSYFSTTIPMSSFVMGISASMEKENSIKEDFDENSINAIKLSLMGPLAGIGDTLFGVTLNTVFGSIAAYMALEGSSIGCYMWILANIAKIIISKGFIKAGYKQGAKLVASVGNVLKNITDSASMLGLMVIGALIPTVVKATVPYVYTSGEAQLVAQEILDKIMPGLVPVAIVALTYWLLGRKKMNSTRVILILIVLSIVLFNLGILA